MKINFVIVFSMQLLITSRAELFDDILETNNQIVGGQPTFQYEYPYQISLQFEEYHICGGSILSNNKILTAAHCPEGLNISTLTVVAGITELTSEGQRVAVLKAYVHESYDTVNFLNDIAILETDRLTFSNSVHKIQLIYINVNDNEFAFVTGWGDTRFRGRASNSLQRLNVITFDRQYCGQQLNRTVPDSQLCVIAGNQHGICHGDSGGPLVFVDPGNCNKRVQIGIVSWGYDCAEGYPDGYTYVPHFKKWIESKMNL